MTHSNPKNRDSIVKFVEAGGRFARYMKFGLSIARTTMYQTGNRVVPLVNNFSLSLSDLPAPGGRGFLKGMANDIGQRIPIQNTSEITTICYRTTNGFLEYAAVTWKPDSGWNSKDEIFNRQLNNAHALERFERAPILVSLDTLPDIGDGFKISKQGYVVYMTEEFSSALVRKFGHWAKRDDSRDSSRKNSSTRTIHFEV